MNTIDRLVQLLEQDGPEINDPEQKARAREIIVTMRDLVWETIVDAMMEVEERRSTASISLEPKDG